MQKCSACDNHESGVFNAPIFCGECVQGLLGYTVVVHKKEKYPFKALRAVLRGEHSRVKGVG